MLSSARTSSSRSTGFMMKLTAPCSRASRIESRAETMWTGMCRVRVSRFSRSRTESPEWSGRPTSSTMACGRYWRAAISPSSAVPATMHLKPSSWARSTVSRAKATSSSTARMIRSSGRSRSRSSATPASGRAPRASVSAGIGATSIRRGAAIGRAGLAAARGLARHGERQADGEGAALAMGALERDLAPQHRRQLARDRQTKAGPAIFAADGAVGLPERLEHRLVLFRADADAAVADRERNALPRAPDHKRDLARLGKLHRVRQEVAQHLFKPRRIGDDLGQPVLDLGLQPQASSPPPGGAKVRNRRVATSAGRTGSGDRSSRPASIFDRSRDVR